MLSRAGFGEKGVERILSATQRHVRRHLTVRLNAVFQTVQFPTGIAHLHASLTHMDADHFPHILWPSSFLGGLGDCTVFEKESKCDMKNRKN